MIKAVLKTTFLLSALMTATGAISVGATEVLTPWPPENLPKPTRQVQARVMIQKFSLSRNVGGGYSYNLSLVCDKSVSVDVFDVRGVPLPSWTTPIVLTCDSDINGKKTRIEGTAAIVIRDQIMFPGEPVAAIRANYFGLRSIAEDGSSNRLVASGDAISRDLSASSILSLSESYTWDCEDGGDCKPFETDIFSAVVEFGP